MIDTLLRLNLLPDRVLRLGIRRLLAQRLREITPATQAEANARHEAFAGALRSMPVAINTADSRAQHYEVPTEFYRAVLGPRLKYSACLFERGDETLAEAEEAMLRLYVERAQLRDGQEVLELGCGWGSLSLWLAQRHPRSRITGVSHSRIQKRFIDDEARRLGITNLTILTADMNEFSAPPGYYDRVVSIEMFEHMKNWPLLLKRIAGWLRPDGLLFIHIFTHRDQPYHFEVRDSSDWMTLHFFSGGMMPSDRLIESFQEDLQVCGHWTVGGGHYQRTAECWLRNMDDQKANLMPLFRETYGGEAALWWSRWRVFFMACAELWGWDGGRTWIVSHYALRPRSGAQAPSPSP